MFERLTDRSRRVIVLAQEAAREFRHNYIGTEHMLLGLAQEADHASIAGLAGQALITLGITQDGVKKWIEVHIGPGQAVPTGHIPFTPRGKKLIELSLREGLQLGHNYIGTEHMLLALTRMTEGGGFQILSDLGVELADVRKTVIELIQATAPAGPDLVAKVVNAEKALRKVTQELFQAYANQGRLNELPSGTYYLSDPIVIP